MEARPSLTTEMKKLLITFWLAMAAIAMSAGKLPLENDANAASLRAQLTVRPDRIYRHGQNASGPSMRAKIDLGMTVAIDITSDSTGVPTLGWPRRLAQKLATYAPNHRVEYRQSSFTYNDNSEPALTIYNSSLERQHWYIPSGAVAGRTARCPNGNLRVNPTGRYLSMEVEATITALAAVNGSNFPTAGASLGMIDGDGSHLAQLTMTSAGRLEFDYFDGSGFNLITSPSGSPVPALAIGTYVRYRVQVDTANGANKSLQFAYSTNQGQTWTNLGAAVTSAKSASPDIAVGTAPSLALGIINSATLYPGWKFSYMQVGIGANYEPIAPGRVDAFNVVDGATSNTALLQGSPIIYIDNYSINGFTCTPVTSPYDYMGQFAANAWRQKPDRQQDASFISVGTNDNGAHGQWWFTCLDALKTTIASRRPTLPTYVLLTQNPMIATVSNQQTAIILEKNMRARQMLTYGGIKKETVIDTDQALRDGPLGLSTYIQADGVHPTDNEGSSLICDTIYKHWFLDGSNTVE